MKNPFFYLLLLILVGLDAWLLANPNLIGRFGIFIYDYTYLASFPRALGTVSAVVGIALVLSWLVGRLRQRPAGIALVTAFLAGAGYWLLSSIQQFTSGVHKLTGSGFRAGAILFPGLVVAIFAKTLYEMFINKSVRARS